MLHLGFVLAFAVHTNGTHVFSCPCVCMIPIHSEIKCVKISIEFFTPVFFLFAFVLSRRFTHVI